jgi:hypothetical protein
MTDPTLTVETLARRLAKVERENRLMRWAGGIVTLGLAAVLVGATKTPTELDVTKLTIRDANGKARGGLAIDKDGPMLSLFDTSGKPRIGLSALADGPALCLYDADLKVTWRTP